MSETQPPQDQKAKGEKTFGEKARDAATVVIGIGTIGAVGAGIGILASNQAETNHDNNQKWEQETNENLRQSEFESGLQENKVTIETPAPKVTEIPAIQQIGSDPVGLQLPTLPAPDKK